MVSDFIKNQLFQIKAQEEKISYLTQNLTNQLNELKNKINTLEQSLNGFSSQQREIEIISEEQLIINQKQNINNNISKPNQEPSTQNKNENSWEMTFGKNWLSRIGIVAILIGLTLALQHSFALFSKELKLMIGIVLSIVLFFAGKKLLINYNILGRALQGGGIALGYLVLYASFFFENTSIFHSDILGYIVLFIYAIFMLTIAELMDSLTIAALGFIFGYFTSYLANNILWSLIPASIFSIMALRLSWNDKKWKKLNIFCLLGSLIIYSIHHNHEYSLSFLIFSFTIYHLASFLKATELSPFFFLLNIFSFYFAWKINHKDLLANGFFELSLAALNIASYLVYLQFETQPLLTNCALTMGLSFIGLSTLSYFDRNNFILACVLSVQALVSGLIAKKITVIPKIYYVFSGILLGLAFLSFYNFVLLNQGSFLVVWGQALWIIGIGLFLDKYVYSKKLVYPSILILIASHFGLILVIVRIVESNYITLTSLIIGIIFLVLGLILKERKYRYSGLIWFLLSSLHLLFVDIRHLETLYKILVFICFGIGLITTSFGYNLLEKHLKQIEESSEKE